MLWCGWILFGFVFVWVVPAMIALAIKQLAPLPRKPAMTASEESSQVSDGALISVIVPARNEGPHIEKSLRSILGSVGVRLELITVNDRSTDVTGRVMDTIAAADARVRVIHVQDLPDDWLGKNHAMHVAAQQAAGRLLLFTDGDVIYEPDAIRTAVAHFWKHRLQHLCLFPRMLPGGILENATVAFFGMAFAIGMQLPLIRTRWPFSYAGIGAFNLVDADTYRQRGGHVPLALDILDDVKLGKLMKRHGGRQDFQSAPRLLSIRWQGSLWQVITGLEKNAFASLNYSLMAVVFATAAFLGTMILPYFAVALFPLKLSSGFLATVILWHLGYGIASIVAGGGFWLAPLFPIAATLLSVAWWRSAWITLRQGGVRWRDSFYPLSKLKPAIYR